MNKKRLLKLADFLDQLPRQKFDFTVIGRLGTKPMAEALKARKESCGTVGCAMGWMPAVFPRLTRWVPLDSKNVSIALRRDGPPLEYDWAVAGIVFGLPLEETIYLFDPTTSDLGRGATPKQVARHIRAFVKRGGMPDAAGSPA